MKNILSVMAGLITGVLVIMLIEAISHKMYPLPPGFDLSKADKETMEFLMEEMMPMGAFMMVLLSYILGSFSGGMISSVISKKIQQPLIVGSVLMVAGIVTLFMIPHPVWFMAVSLPVYIPFALAGGKIGMMFKKREKNNV